MSEKHHVVPTLNNSSEKNDSEQHRERQRLQRLKDTVYKVECLENLSIDTGQAQIRCKLRTVNAGTYHVQNIDIKATSSGYTVACKVVTTTEFTLTIKAEPYNGKTQLMKFVKGEVIAEARLI
jgi:hypothetical protein